MKTYIYILQDPNTQEVKYVGKSISPNRRYYYHANRKAQDYNRRHLSNWLKVLLDSGKKPIMTIIDEAEDDWEELEIYWIAQFKQWGFNLCNHSEGGQGNSYGLGSKVLQLSLKGDKIKQWNTISEAATALGINRSKISLVCTGDRKQCGGFKWKYIGTPKGHSKGGCKECTPANKVVVRLLDDVGNEIGRFDSMSEAADFYNIHPSCIHNNIKRLSKKTKQGIWQKV